MALRRHESNAKTEFGSSRRATSAPREKVSREIRELRLAMRRKIKSLFYSAIFSYAIFEDPTHLHTAEMTSITFVLKYLRVSDIYLMPRRAEIARLTCQLIRGILPRGYYLTIFIISACRSHVRARLMNSARTSKISPANGTPCPARRARNNQLENYALIG